LSRRGDGTQLANAFYVDDAAEAIVLPSERYDRAEPVNIGSDFEVSIKDPTRSPDSPVAGDWCRVESIAAQRST
jgi:hypothetical protein